jgi:DNA mismatch endonuclease (patch repair protein)
LATTHVTSSFLKPRGNAAFWRKKIAGNRARDRLVNRRLRMMGWKVRRIWEHALAKKSEARLLRGLERTLMPGGQIL